MKSVDTQVFPCVCVIHIKTGEFPSSGDPNPLVFFPFDPKEKIVGKGKNRIKPREGQVVDKKSLKELVASGSARNPGLSNGFTFVKKNHPAFVPHLFKKGCHAEYLREVFLRVCAFQGGVFIKFNIAIFADISKGVYRYKCSGQGPFEQPWKLPGTVFSMFFKGLLFVGQRYGVVGRRRQQSFEEMRHFIGKGLRDAVIVVLGPCCDVLRPGFPSRKKCPLMVRKADSRQKLPVYSPEIVKGDLPGVQVDHAGYEPVLQRFFLKVGQRVAFALAVVPADAQMGRKIVFRGRKAPVKGSNQFIFMGGEQSDRNRIKYPFPQTFNGAPEGKITFLLEGVFK